MAWRAATSDDYIYWQDPRITSLTANLSIAARIKLPSATVAAPLTRIGDSGALGANLLSPSRTVSIFRRFSSTNITRVTSTILPQNEWFSIILTSTPDTTASTTKIYINGIEAAYASSTNGSGTVVVSDTASAHGVVFYADAEKCDVCVWNEELTADDIAAIVNGVSAKRIRPSAIRLYAPMIRNPAGTTSALGGYSSLTITDHPRVI